MILAHSSVTVHHCGNIKAVYHIQSRNIEGGMCAPARHPFSIYTNQDPSRGMEPPQWVDLPTLINVIYIIIYTGMPRGPLQAILEPVKLIIDTITAGDLQRCRPSGSAWVQVVRPCVKLT